MQMVDLIFYSCPGSDLSFDTGSRIMKSHIIDSFLTSGLAKQQTLGADQQLFCLGDQCEHYVVIRKGVVRVELLSSAGQQLLLYRIVDGQSCVMTTSCLLGDSRYFAQAITESPVELILLTRDNFDKQLRASAEFRDFVFSGFHERFADLMGRTAELVSSTIDQRLAAALLAECDAPESDQQIELTHQQLAIDIGSAREVVSRRLASFDNRGIIERNRGSIKILDAEKLRLILSTD